MAPLTIEQQCSCGTPSYNHDIACPMYPENQRLMHDLTALAAGQVAVTGQWNFQDVARRAYDEIMKLTGERNRAVEAVSREGRHERRVEIEQLRAALLEAVAVIKTWHDMPSLHNFPMPGAGDVWDIYWLNAPEMKSIREALLGLGEKQ